MVPLLVLWAGDGPARRARTCRWGRSCRSAVASVRHATAPPARCAPAYAVALAAGAVAGARIGAGRARPHPGPPAEARVRPLPRRWSSIRHARVEAVTGVALARLTLVAFGVLTGAASGLLGRRRGTSDGAVPDARGRASPSTPPRRPRCSWSCPPPSSAASCCGAAASATSAWRSASAHSAPLGGIARRPARARAARRNPARPVRALPAASSAVRLLRDGRGLDDELIVDRHTTSSTASRRRSRRGSSAARSRRDSRLRQATLAAEFGVSRTPVREALRKLAVDGSRRRRAPQGGGCARARAPGTIREAYLVRAELEGLAAELATAHLTDDAARPAPTRPRTCSAGRSRPRSAGDRRARRPRRGRRGTTGSGANDLFHEVIQQAAGNRRAARDDRVPPSELPAPPDVGRAQPELASPRGERRRSTIGSSLRSSQRDSTCGAQRDERPTSAAAGELVAVLLERGR